MSDVKITHETLFDLMRREKDREELQELDETFYKDVMSYLEQKREFIKDSSADSFGESEETIGQIKSIKTVLKGLHDRRQDKIIRLAINKSKVDGSLINTLAMLPEEKEFFDNLLSVLRNYREEVINKILLFGNGQKAAKVAKQEPEPEISSDNNQKEASPEKIHQSELTDAELEAIDKVDEGVGDTASSDNEDENSSGQTSESESHSESIKEAELVDEKKDDYDIRIKVKFTAQVPEFVGKRLETYGPYKEGDIDELPQIIANILLNENRAKKLE